MWQRIAAFFSFLALASALLAPSTLLAEEVRTGKLGGLCGVASLLSGEQGNADAVLPQTHCDLCGSSASLLLPGVKQPFAAVAQQGTLRAGGQSEVSARERALASIRGPPEH